MSHAATRARIIGDDEDPDECEAEEELGVVAADMIGKEYAKAAGNPTAEIVDGAQEDVDVPIVKLIKFESIVRQGARAGQLSESTPPFINNRPCEIPGTI
jgi:hypothetical protein